MKIKKIIWIYRQPKYHQLRTRSEICILLEIVPHAVKYLTVLLSTQIFISAIAPHLFISVSILCEFAMLPEMYLLLFPQEEEVHSSSWVDRCICLTAHSSKRLDPLSVIILACLGNTLKTTLQDKLLPHWSS